MRGHPIQPADPVPLLVEVADPQNDLPYLPPGFAPDQMKGLDGGTGYSGLIDELLPGQRKRLANCSKRGADGMIACATMHVMVKELRKFGAHDAPIDQRLVIWLSFQSGRGGGDEIPVDATGGALITLPGTISVAADAELLSTDPTSGVTLTIEATVHWGTSVSPKPVFNVASSITFIAPGPFPANSARIAIPSRAQRMTLLADSAVALANCQIDFRRDAASLGGPTYVYNQPDPTRAIPIVSGVRVYSLHYLGPATATFIPTFRLAL